MSAADKQADAVDNNELLSLKVLAENRAVFARSSLFERVSSLLFEGEGELRPELREALEACTDEEEEVPESGHRAG